MATPLESCRVAPYVNLATIRNSSTNATNATTGVLPLSSADSNVNVENNAANGVNTTDSSIGAGASRTEIAVDGRKSAVAVAAAVAAASHLFQSHPYLGVVNGGGTSGTAHVSAFDPAIISAAAHQVRLCVCFQMKYSNLNLLFSVILVCSHSWICSS